MILATFLDFSITGTNTIFPRMLSGTTNDFFEDPVLQTAPGQRGFQFVSTTFPFVIGVYDFQLQARSTGTISVYSADASQMGKLDTNILNDPQDLASWRTHLRWFVSSVVAADPFVIPIFIDNTTLYDDNLLNQWLFQNVLFYGSTYHNYGSCQMGANSSVGAVDTDFKVFGASNLRVCDTQVLPIQTDGNPSYAVAALGRICAETILGIQVPPAKKKKTAPPKPNMKKIAAQKRTKQQQQARAAATPQEHYDAIVNYFGVIKQKLRPQAAQIINGIMQTDLWKSLEAQFGPYVP